MFAPTRTDIPPGFNAWLDRMDREGRIYLPVVTVREIERGVARLETQGANAKARALRAWLVGLVAA